MKRNTFIVLMVVEGFFALISMGLLFSDVGAVIYLIALAVFAVVLAPFFVRLKKESDEKKRKIRRNMALILLIPIVAAVVAIALVVIGLMILYS